MAVGLTLGRVVVDVRPGRVRVAVAAVPGVVTVALGRWDVDVALGVLVELAPGVVVAVALVRTVDDALGVLMANAGVAVAPSAMQAEVAITRRDRACRGMRSTKAPVVSVVDG